MKVKSVCFVILSILQVCILEKLARLQATLLKERDDCLESPYIAFSISLDQGTPVLLFFSMTGDNSSFFETKQMNSKRGIFHIGHPIQGMEKICKT